MSAVPFSKISTPLNALFATIGLLVVAALTTQGLTGQERLVFELLLAAIWLAYVLQLSGTLLSRRHRLSGGMPALVIDLLAVLVPAAAFLFVGSRDRNLYCAIWLLKPLRELELFQAASKGGRE